MENGTIVTSALGLAGLTITLFAGFSWIWKYPYVSKKLFLRFGVLFLAPFDTFVLTPPVALINVLAGLVSLSIGVALLLVDSAIFVWIVGKAIQEKESVLEILHSTSKKESEE